MENLYNYLSDPQTIINIVVLVFGIGVTRANLNNRIKKTEEGQSDLKEKIDKIDVVRIETKLTQIQTDLEWLKNEWKNRKK